MKSIDDLIAKYCPYGVEYKELWQLTIWDKKFNEVERDKQPTTISYHYFLADELEQMAVSGGTIKLLTTSPSNIFTSEEIADDKISEGEIVSIPWGGYPHVQYYKGRFLTADNRIATSRDIEVLDNKFLYYIMANRTRTINSFYRGSGIKHPSMARVLNLPIPLPHIEIQREIVRILDDFTGLIDELEAELAARRKQYEQYRDRVLESDIGTYKKVTVSDVCKNICSGGTPTAGNGKFYNGNIPWLRTQEVDWRDIVKTSLTITEEGLSNSSAKWIPANCVIVAMYGATAGKVAINRIPLTTNQACCNLEIDENVAEYKFVFYWLSYRYAQLKKLGQGTQSNINAAIVKKFPINLPSLQEQKRIVETLDKFDALCNDETSGLAAEIAARKKQYEYYRDKLLTFKRKAS